MSIYQRGVPYGEHIIRILILRVTIATQPNIAGTYTKYIDFPGVFFGRNYMGAQLKICGVTVFNTISKGRE